MRFGQNWSNNKYFFFFLIYDNRRRDKKVSVSPSPLQDFSRENLSMHPWRAGRGEDWKRDEILATEGSVIRLLQDWTKLNTSEEGEFEQCPMEFALSSRLIPLFYLNLDVRENDAGRDERDSAIIIIIIIPPSIENEFRGKFRD